MIAPLRPAVLILLWLSLLTGIAYPLAATAIAQLCFPRAANGSLIERGGSVVGSELVGQSFDGPGFFWSRPSAGAYATLPAAGSNAGPLSRAMLDRVADRAARLRAAHAGAGPIPVDLVAASGSGIDPHVSVAAARFQVQRVASERGLTVAKVEQLLAARIEDRQLGLLGEPRVNVLLLNLDLVAVEGSR